MANTWDAPERRRHERVACQLELLCTVMNPTPHEYGTAYAVDISESGACIFGRHPVDRQVVMQLDMRIPRLRYRHLVMAKVLRCKETEESDVCEINVEFIGRIPKDLKKQIVEEIWTDVSDLPPTGPRFGAD